jgi:hypothetical protein
LLLSILVDYVGAQVAAATMKQARVVVVSVSVQTQGDPQLLGTSQVKHEEVMLAAWQESSPSHATVSAVIEERAQEDPPLH